MTRSYPSTQDGKIKYISYPRYNDGLVFYIFMTALKENISEKFDPRCHNISTKYYQAEAISVHSSLQ